MRYLEDVHALYNCRIFKLELLENILHFLIKCVLSKNRVKPVQGYAGEVILIFKLTYHAQLY